jgi:hypothetical protein
MTQAAPVAAPAPALIDGSTTPAASDILKPLEAATMPTTPEAWEARRVELIGDPHLRNAYLSGDIEAQKRMKKVFAGLNPKVDLATVEGREYAARQEALTPLKMTSSLPAEFWDGLARGTPVTLAEREWALQTKEQCFRDKGWVRKVLDGDREATALKTRFNAIIASRVKSANEVARYREAGNKFLNGGK